MKRSILFSICVLGFSCSGTFAQIVLNGSFEDNGGQCLYNISNEEYTANMEWSTGFGPASQLDIIASWCGFGPAQSGDWFVALAISIDYLWDGLSLTLSEPLLTGHTYTLTFWDCKSPSYETNYLEIGVSPVANDFGISIYTTTLPVEAWREHVVTFTAPVTGEYITVQAIPGSYGWAFVDSFSLGMTTSIEPATFELAQNYPNPFNPTTNISFTLDEPDHVTLAVYNAGGRQVALLVDGQRALGSHQVTFDAGDLPSGIYFYQLKTGSGLVETKKMVLAK